MIQSCPRVPSALAHHPSPTPCLPACSLWQGVQPHLPPLARRLLPCSQAKPLAACSLMPRSSCYLLCAKCPSVWSFFSLFLNFPSISSSVLHEHLSIPLKTDYIKIFASLFVFLPTRLQISGGEDLAFSPLCSLSYWHCLAHSRLSVENSTFRTVGQKVCWARQRTILPLGSSEAKRGREIKQAITTEGRVITTVVEVS